MRAGGRRAVASAKATGALDEVDHVTIRQSTEDRGTVREQMKSPLRLIGIAAVSLGLVAAGCSGSKTSSATTAAPATTVPATTTTVSPLTGSLTVLAAASLTEGFNDAKTKLTATNPGLSITYSFAGSQALVTQIQNGAPADVFASADTANMTKLVTAGLVDPPVTFARNKLEIAVAPGNPKNITGLTDLAKPDLKVVLEDPSVPAGNYARQALTKLNITVKPVSNPLDVKSALLAVTSGEADAVVVYVTDVTSAGAKAQGVPIPDDQNIIATYPIAVVKTTKNQAAAQAFVDSMVSGDGQKALLARGFLAPA
jgi:molybdate transport system substrate-binding protein